jgi:putative oxidoreductase
MSSQMATSPSSVAYNAILPLAGRMFLSAIFLISGVGKVAAPAATIGYIASTGLPFPQLGLAIAVFTELGVGTALLVGYRTRMAATWLAIFCLATAAIFHSSFGDQNQFIHFLKNIAMCGGLLQVVAFGPGRFSLDARRRPT